MSSLYENLLEALGQKIILYHGTQAKFNTFDNKYINSGWGEQSYGYGFYLTDSEQCAKEYSRSGEVIKVEVPAKKYLDYNGITKKESTQIAKAFFKYYTEEDEYGKQAYPNREDKQEFWNEECKYIIKCDDGGDIYGTISSLLGSNEQTSKFLHSLGYIGIKYPASNGTTGEKFTNYVIFDASDIKIIN